MCVCGGDHSVLTVSLVVFLVLLTRPQIFPPNDEVDESNVIKQGEQISAQ